ncbi:MAG: hypothetical protein O3A93_00245 [Chloroflexi bacterium]|nr:hypothetical protein [Chloroflexota bacterium]MDA1269678.1 hypothetical protein [Chloroflexota bacterium]PKB58384.1 MAG: hypothetical protein BZY83_07310 [SAR202 cluster bacterium Casp-Chloro-G2]
MNIYYRGYVINEEIPSISYSVHGRRPERSELTARSTARQAMEWIDGDVKREAILGAAKALQPLAS